MSLQNTPAAERVHIAFFGVRNVGKSSVVNAVTGQELSIVSDVKGTTTDPVKKTMELLPIGPVVIIDTPGIDDVGELGEERVRRTKRILNQTDIAVLVVSFETGLQPADRELAALLQKKNIPFLIAVNKTDLAGTATCNADSGTGSGDPQTSAKKDGTVRLGGICSGNTASLECGTAMYVSALTGAGIEELKEALGSLAKTSGSERPLVRDLVNPGDPVILVVPIDKAAPKGRLILPQQMVIRDLLDVGAVPVVVRDSEYASVLHTLFGIPEENIPAAPGRECPSHADRGLREGQTNGSLCPALVITDSQVFGRISVQTPEDIPLTSFSMLMSRYKGNLEQAVRGAKFIHDLRDGDTVLISEGCTHHRQCGDIGTVKLPKWLEDFTGKKLQYAFTSGNDFPEDLSPYRLVIHCGGCMLNEREMRSRAQQALDENVPMTNYGVAIAEIHGILDRCVQPLL